MSPGLAEHLPADGRRALTPALRREPWFQALEPLLAAERARYRVFPPGVLPVEMKASAATPLRVPLRNLAVER